MARREVSVKTERNPQNRDAESRSRPFAAVLLVAWVGIPAFALLLRLLVGVGGDGIKVLVIALVMTLLGAALPGFAIAYGFKVARRHLVVVWHVAVTLHLFALSSALAVVPGWDTVSAGQHWWNDAGAWLLNVFAVPMWFVVTYLITSLCVALSWLIYRIDAFRASTGTAGVDDTTPLGKLIARLDGVKINTDQAQIDDIAAEIPIDHEGVPLAQVRQLIPVLEEHPGMVRGRSAVIEGERGGHSILRAVHSDPHADGKWRVWPGLSAPGGSFTEPIRTSYYSTGETQWYSFVATPQDVTFAPGPGEDKSTKLGRAQFRSPNGVFKGAQGMTSSGKSGDAAIEVAETLSRRNVHVIYVDPAKLLQNAGWCLDFCSLAAGSPAMTGHLFGALRNLFEYRASVLGDARNFTDEVAERTGMSWVYVFADEFDIAKQGAAMDWLATKGRSLGLRLSFTLPRAVGDKLSTDIRAAIGMWGQFGITQDYDKGFVLSDETIAAGANPEKFGASLPGVHYLDRAPGIPSRMWSVDCRSYRTREDFADLRRAVEAARATFTAPVWTPGELQALGSVARDCAPSVVRNGTLGTGRAANRRVQPAAAPPVMSPVKAFALATEAGAVEGVSDTDRVTLVNALNNERNSDMQDTQQLPPGLPTDEDLEDMSYGAQVQALLDDADEVLDTSDEEREYGPLNARIPDPEPQPDGLHLNRVKPAPTTPEQAVYEFEQALFRMALQGVTEFGNADVHKEMRVDMSSSWVSKRFTELCGGATATAEWKPGQVGNPPVVTIERIEGSRGRFTLVRLG